MIIPVGENLLLEPVPVEESTAGGLYIPDSVRQTPDKGKILAAGSAVKDEKLAEGVTVLFRKGVGETIKYKSVEYLILPVKEVIGILKGD